MIKMFSVKFFYLFVFIVSLSVFGVVTPVQAKGKTKIEFKNEVAFDVWLKNLKKDAIKLGISKEMVDRALSDDLKPIKSVIKWDRRQPENTITFEKYKTNILTKKRISTGRKLLKAHEKELNIISKAFGVEPRFIVALWGMETNYGTYMGGYEIVPALATLAYDGRRSKFFRSELMNALKILDQGHIKLEDMKGSWAGAMGQSQFMPSSFLRYAVDYDQDGRRDIWNTRVDVFASASNYLAQNGWIRHEIWGQEVTLPKEFSEKYVGIKIKKSLSSWKKLGIKAVEGDNLPTKSNSYASLVQPGGKKGSTYLIYNNYRSIMKWNRSLYFATSIGLLADELL